MGHYLESAKVLTRMKPDDKLWLEAEQNIAKRFDAEELRTSGLLAGRKRLWTQALVRLSEAARHGLRDLQLLDTLGEAAYRTKTYEAILPYMLEYRDPLIATHMARALMDTGDREGAAFYLKIARDSALKTAILAMMGFKNTIEDTITSMLGPVEAAIHRGDRDFLQLDYPAFWHALTPVADAAGRLDIVEIAEERSKALDFKNPSVHYNQALRFLARRDLRAGWQLYEWRLHPDAGGGNTGFGPIPMWQGENLAGKTLAVAVQYGFGDQIFSLRFIKEAIAHLPETEIEIVADAPVFALVAQSFPNQRLHKMQDCRSLEYWQSQSRADYWSYAFSLPSRLGLWHPVQMGGYLTANADLVESIGEEIHLESGAPGLPVFGIVWHGDMATHAMRTRAYRIEEFLEQTGVLQKPSVIVNLQKDVTNTELAFLQTQVRAAGGMLINAAPELTDFAQTAAWIKNLDRLYSCDTSVAHLGGALGHPTTVLVRNKSIWHWIQRESSSVALWYDSATIQHALVPKHSYMFDLFTEEEIAGRIAGQRAGCGTTGAVRGTCS
jgi:hypothetical protein